MAEYDNRNTFTLFRNSRKTADTHADFNGTFTDEEGNEYWMNAWAKAPKAGGEKFLSGNIKIKTPKSEAAPRGAAPARAKPLDDDLPF